MMIIGIIIIITIFRPTTPWSTITDHDSRRFNPVSSVFLSGLYITDTIIGKKNSVNKFRPTTPWSTITDHDSRRFNHVGSVNKFNVLFGSVNEFGPTTFTCGDNTKKT